MDASLLKAIQGGKGLKKVPDSQKNDRSAAQGGNVGGAAKPANSTARQPNNQSSNSNSSRPAPSYGGSSGGMSMMDEIRLKQQRRAQGGASPSKNSYAPKPIPKKNFPAPNLPTKTSSNNNNNNSNSMPSVPKPPGPKINSNMPPVPKPPTKMQSGTSMMPPVPRPPGPPSASNMPPVPKPPGSNTMCTMPPVPRPPAPSSVQKPKVPAPPPSNRQVIVVNSFPSSNNNNNYTSNKRQPPPSLPPHNRGPVPTIPTTRPPIPSKAGRTGRGGKKPPPLPSNQIPSSRSANNLANDFANRFQFSPINQLPKPVQYDDSPKTPLHTQYIK